MKEYLVFRLYGPMASWGQAAVGGDRPTGMQPTRSAVLGLLGAAIGIKRADDAALQALQKSVLVAVKQCVPSSLMRDFHTTQVPAGGEGKLSHCRTRKLEVDENDFQVKFNAKNSRPNAILSSRDYRCDGVWVIAISLSEQATVSLEQLKSSLLKPVYILSLGRKSCPLAAPLQPKLVAHDKLQQALDTKFPALTRSIKEDNLWLGYNKRVTYFWEGDKTEVENSGVLTTHPWDEPVHRGRWQFKQRDMHQLSVEEKTDVSI